MPTAEPKSARSTVTRISSPVMASTFPLVPKMDTASCSVSRFTSRPSGAFCRMKLVAVTVVRCMSLKEMRSVARVTPLRFSHPSGMGMA